MQIRITRKVNIPDPIKLERYRRAPELGPRVLFFSGGTALRETSKVLIRYTHNSIHTMTPFDSGGSSAELRKHFHMPAVGDIRCRLMALADQTIKGNPEIYALFAYRLSKETTQDKLLSELQGMADGFHPLVRTIPDPMRRIIRNDLHRFIKAMPRGFNLKGASIGNLILTAGFLASHRQMEPVLYHFSKLVQVCGTVHLVVNTDMHMAAELADGTVVVGQHLLTGKESLPIQSKIKRVWLTRSVDDSTPAGVSIGRKTTECIGDAELICFPIGSFYTSVVANILPDGVGKAVAANPCPKVFVPNPFYDPELIEHSVEDQVATLQRHLVQSGAPHKKGALHFVLVDTQRGAYPGGIDTRAIRNLGVEIIDVQLIADQTSADIDKDKLTGALLSLT